MFYKGTQTFFSYIDIYILLKYANYMIERVCMCVCVGGGGGGGCTDCSPTAKNVKLSKQICSDFVTHCTAQLHKTTVIGGILRCNWV